MDKINFQNGVTKVNADTFNTFQNNIYQMQNEIGVVVNPTEPTGDNRRKVWMQKGKNLIHHIIKGYEMASTSNGDVSVSADWYITDYIPVQGNTSYIASGFNIHDKWWFDENKNFISCSDLSNISPSNARYLRMNGRIANDTNIQIEQGSTATEYEEYIEPKIYVKNDNDVYEEFISKEDTSINYSTTEQKIGTWTDGKPLYRKIVSGTFGTVTQDKESTVEINLPNVNFVLVDKYWLNRISINNAINQGTTEGLIYLGYTSIYSSGSTVRFRTKQSWASNLTVYAIIIYTKTTD